MPWEAIYALPVRDLLKRDASSCCAAPGRCCSHGGDVKRHYAGHDAGARAGRRVPEGMGRALLDRRRWRKVTKTGKLARGTRYRVWNVCEPFMIGIVGSAETIGSENCFDGICARALAQARELFAFCEAT
jgi:hypothetical protein